MLALSAWLAIKEAISAIGNHEFEPEFSLPATNEVILLSIEQLKRQMIAAISPRMRASAKISRPLKPATAHR